MVVLVLIGIGFRFLAKARGLHQVLWVALACLSYLAGQFIIRYILEQTHPELLDKLLSYVLVSLGAGLGGAAICWLVMEWVAKRKREKQKEMTDELLDDRYSDPV